MLQHILAKVELAGPASKWYNQVIVKNLHREGNKPLKVQKYIVVKFDSPPTTSATQFWSQTPVAITPHFITPTSASPVTVVLQLSEPYEFTADNTLNFGINGDMTDDPEKYLKSFSLIADPAGFVDIESERVPDKALVGCKLQLTFTQGSLVIPVVATPGSPLSFPILPGTYKVTAAELADKDETVVAPAHASPNIAIVENAKTTVVKVTYGPVENYCAIDVAIGNISQLQQEQFHVKVVAAGQTLREFWSAANHTTPLRRLPISDVIDVSVEATVNNVKHSFKTKSVSGTAKLHKVTFQHVDTVMPIPTTGFVELPIKVTTDGELDAKLTVRLIGHSPTYLMYTQEVTTGTTKMAVPVAPAKYTVQAAGFIRDYTVYAVESPATLTVENNGSTTLPLRIVAGANLDVPGFPNFLSFGGITNLPPDGTDKVDFEKARASSIFKYIGDGDGHPGGYMAHDGDVVATIIRAHDVGQKLGQSVLPVLIAYTINLSGGDPIRERLTADSKIACSFGNLILSFKEAHETIKKHKVDAVGYIVNPDFIGACQQSKLDKNTTVHVRKPMQEALKHWKDLLQDWGVDTEIPSHIEENLHGYVLAVNWLVRTIAEKLPFVVTFGWQVNLWGTGSVQWIYSKENVAVTAQKVANYVKELGVYDGPNSPDFLAIDRYERDDFTVECYGNKYCFGPHEWVRFFDFCKALSLILKLPVMPWQIPSSRTPLRGDSVTNIEEQHWGTGGSYILGDAGLGSDYDNANQKILALEINIFDNYKTVKDLFAVQPFDWSKPAYSDFPLHGIFAVLLGGGSTTGIISKIGNAGPWVLDRLGAYGKNPIPLDNTAGADD